LLVVLFLVVYIAVICGCSETTAPEECEVWENVPVFQCDTIRVNVVGTGGVSTFDVIQCNRWICVEGCD